jgi:hypothetical protein
VQLLDLNTMHTRTSAQVHCAERTCLLTVRAASMPSATRNLQPGSAARSVGGRVLLQWRRIAAYLENAVLRLIASVAISAPLQQPAPSFMPLMRWSDGHCSRP